MPGAEHPFKRTNDLSLKTFTLSGAGDGNLVVAHLNAARQWTQAMEVRGRNYYDFQGSTLALDANGDVAAAGSFSGGQVTFGSCNLNNMSSPADIFVARLSSAGQ